MQFLVKERASIKSQKTGTDGKWGRLARSFLLLLLLQVSFHVKASCEYFQA